MNREKIGWIIIGAVVVFAFLLFQRTGDQVFGGSPKSGGETSKQSSISTTANTVLDLDGRRTYLYIGPSQSTTTNPIVFWCSPGTTATSSFGWSVISFQSSSPRVIEQIGDDVWKGSVTCIGQGNVTATVVAY